MTSKCYGLKKQEVESKKNKINKKKKGKIKKKN